MSLKTLSFISVALLVSLASASKDDFPEFDMFHANCAMNVTYSGKQCS